MSMQLGSKGIQSEMNVTPLIDVVLVMLIIFMVATPLLEKRFVLAVPESEVPEQQDPQDKPEAPLVVNLQVDGSISLNDETLPLALLLDKVRSSLRHRDSKVVFFDAADMTNFGEAVDTMDAVRGVGAKHIGIIEPAPAGLDLPAAPTGDPIAAPDPLASP